MDINSNNAINYSISELVSYIRTTFLPKEYERFEQILMVKEEKVREEAAMEIEKLKKEAALEIDKLKKEADLNEKKYDELVLSKLETEDEMKALKRECDEFREQILRLKEDNRVTSDRERRAEERYKKSLDEVNKLDLKLLELQTRNSVLEREKRSAKAEMELGKKLFNGLEIRVSRLEKDSQMLMTEVGPSNAQPSEVKEMNGKIEGPNSSHMDHNYVMKVKEERDPLNSQIAEGHTSRVIQIVDTDDELPENNCASASKHKRTRVLCENDIDGQDDDTRYDPPSGKRRTKLPQELNHGDTAAPTSSRGNLVETSVQHLKVFGEGSLSSDSSSSTSDSSSSDDEKEVNDCLSVKSDRNRTTTWGTESDMLSELKNCPELCMRAVCALYREKFFEEKAYKDLEHSNNKKMDTSDALRLIMLAKFLIDGDQQAKLKKSILELRKYDPEGIDECKRLATKYSKKLFEIYLRRMDPLFLPL